MRFYGDPEPGDVDELAWASEVILDALLYAVEGKDDSDLVFVDGWFRSFAEQLGVAATFPEMEPMLAGEFRRRHREAKAALAAGEGPRRGERVNPQ